MQPVQKFFGHLLLPSLKVNKRVVDASCIKVLWTPFVTFKVNKRVVDASCIKVLWSPFVTFSQGKQKSS